MKLQQDLQHQHAMLVGLIKSRIQIMEGSRSQVVSGRVRSELGGGSTGGADSQVIINVGAGDDAPRPPAPAPQGLNDRYIQNVWMYRNIKNVWYHGTKFSGQGFKCRYCGYTARFGGATRLRDHLGCIVGEVKSCPSVPRVVRYTMMALWLDQSARGRNGRRVRVEEQEEIE